MSKEKQVRQQVEHVQRKALDSSASATSATDDLGAMSRASAVQRKELGGAAPDNAVVHDAAAQGKASPTRAMPHGDKIQASFGPDHDVSKIQAHVGGDSAAKMGASAFAADGHAVFDSEPDLHTAAHEAAHVVQQDQGVNLYGGVGQAGDGYEQQADAVADRVVAGQSSADLLGGPSKGSSGKGGAVQRKEAPNQAYADQMLMNSIRAHIKLTATRMHSAAAEITHRILKMDTKGDAGTGHMVNATEVTVTAVNKDLDNLAAEVSHAGKDIQGARNLEDELGTLQGAFHQSWAPALNKISQFKLGDKFTVSYADRQINDVYTAAGVDRAKANAVMASTGGDDTLLDRRDDELKAAELDGLKSGMAAVQTAHDLVKSDLHSSVSDQSKEAQSLTVAVETLVGVFEPISPDHIGKIATLPVLIKQVEVLQAEVMKMKDAGDTKGKALAPKIGYNTPLSSNLKALKDKIAFVKTVKKPAKR